MGWTLRVSANVSALPLTHHALHGSTHHYLSEHVDSQVNDADMEEDRREETPRFCG